MGYFPNGTSGEIFEANVCAKCVHEGNCAVWDLHLFKNYDQLKDGQEQLRDALNMLIPDDTVECKMFVDELSVEKVKERKRNTMQPDLIPWDEAHGVI